MGTLEDFAALIENFGSTITYHRDDSAVPCPCRTPEGYRDPVWHVQNPSAPVCNAAGMLPTSGVSDFLFKGFVQPVQAGAVRRLVAEQLFEAFIEILSDDQVGIFPVTYNGHVLNMFDWGAATEDYIIYANRKFTCVNANLIAAPDTGYPWHHWECGLRFLGTV